MYSVCSAGEGESVRVCEMWTYPVSMDEHHECIPLAGRIKLSLQVAVDQLRGIGDETLKVPATDTMCKAGGVSILGQTFCSCGADVFQ